MSLEFVNAKKWKLNKIIFKGFWMFVFAKIKMRYIWSSVVLSTVNMIFASCISLKTQTHIYSTRPLKYLLLFRFVHLTISHPQRTEPTYTVPNIIRKSALKPNQTYTVTSAPALSLCLLIILVQEKPPKHCLTCRQWVGEKLRGKHGHYYHSTHHSSFRSKCWNKGGS